MITSEAVRFSQRVRKEEREMFSGKWQGTRSTRRALLSVGHKKRAASCKVATERGEQNTENRAQNKTEEEEISSRSEQPILLLLPLSSRARQGRSHSHRRATLSPPPWRRRGRNQCEMLFISWTHYSEHCQTENLLAYRSNNNRLRCSCDLSVPSPLPA